ncbi:MAG: NUDIX domain-containing protein [Candidatus Melainabacteria bacterium]
MTHQPGAYIHKVRVGVVLVHADRLLLARQNDRPFWVFPGGTLEAGETLAACGAREIREETGLTVAIGPLLSVSEFFRDTADGPRQTIDVLFLGDNPQGTLCMETTENLNELAWFTRAEVAAMTLQPQEAAMAALAAWDNGFQDIRAEYLSGACAPAAGKASRP